MDHSTKDTFEVLNAMMKQESSSYLTESGLYDQSKAIDGECRRLMVSWCIQVSDFCKFDRNTVFIAINILDRFMAKERHILNENNNQFQLSVIACFYTAVKTSEPMALDPVTVANLSKGKFSAKQIEDMEFKILTTLGWRVNVPTASSFADLFLKLLLPSELTNERRRRCIFKLIQHQIIYATRDSKFVGVSTSELAFTATCNAIEIIFGNFSCEKARRNLQQSIDVNLLPFALEKELMLQAQNSAILTDFFIPAPSTQKMGRRKSKNLGKKELSSPRCVVMC